MSQLAQLSEAEIEERFHISSRTAIQFMLAGFVRSRDAFSVQFGGAHDLFLSTMLAVEPERLIFDCSGSPETNQLFLKSGRNIFVGRPGGIQVHFSTGAASEIDFEGGKAFAVELPKVLVRLQRRDNFRIETPRVRPLEFFARLPDGGLLSLPVHDISVCGIGLTATATASPPGLAPGSLLANCHFSLPEETSDLFFSATLRHLSELEGRAGQRQWRLGLQFNDLPANDAKRIQRYIIRIEHERHELA